MLFLKWPSRCILWTKHRGKVAQWKPNTLEWKKNNANPPNNVEERDRGIPKWKNMKDTPRKRQRKPNKLHPGILAPSDLPTVMWSWRSWSKNGLLLLHQKYIPKQSSSPNPNRHRPFPVLDVKAGSRSRRRRGLESEQQIWCRSDVREVNMLLNGPWSPLLSGRNFKLSRQNSAGLGGGMGWRWIWAFSREGRMVAAWSAGRLAVAQWGAVLAGAGWGWGCAKDVEISVYAGHLWARALPQDVAI